MLNSWFEKKIKPILLYIGTIGAVLMVIAYIVIVLTMIFGMSAAASIQETLIFAAVNAVVGILIMQFLKIQGISFAKNIEANQDTLKRYNANKSKKKKLRSIRYFWITSVTKDIIGRAVIIIITTLCVIYLVIVGTYDYTYLLLALVNLVMFACFGLLALVNAYDFFNEEHIPYLEEQINETEQKAEAEKRAREEAIEAEIARRVAVAQEELAQQRNSHICADRGAHLLESCDCECDTCHSSRHEVLDSGNELCGVLGTTDNTGLGATDSTDSGAKESLAEIKTTEAEKE